MFATWTAPVPAFTEWTYAGAVDDQQKPQVIRRATALLRALAAAEPTGATTSELASATGLARPTVHRLLTTLADEGLADRDHRSGRWSIGPELYLLGSLAASRYDIVDIARPVLRDLARTTGESTFLSVRRGDETVCVAAEEGSFPLRSHVLHIGIRLPLGVASAGLVILAHLAPHDVADYLDRVDLTEEWGERHARDAVTERLVRTRETGYSLNPGLLVEGSWGMGAAVFDDRDEPAWALSVTGVESRFGVDRRSHLGELLLREAHRLTRALRQRHPVGDT